MVRNPEDIRWFHSIDLGNGLITRGQKSHDLLLEESKYVFRFSPAGLTVLDVGAWDGFFSFEAERRGGGTGAGDGSFLLERAGMG